MPAVVAAISWLFGKIVADNVLRFIAMKLLVGTIFLVIVPILLNNVLYDFLEIVLQVASENSPAAGSVDGHMVFSGFAAWLVTGFKIPECVSVIGGALLMRLTLSMIPFLRV